MKLDLGEPIFFDRKTPLDKALAVLKAPMDIDENIVDDELKPKWAYRPADGIHKLLYRDLESGVNGGMFTPDGTYVVNAAGTLRYKMLPDSTLLDEKSGEIFTTAGLYNQIRELPIEAADRGAVIRNQVLLHDEDKFPNLKAHGKVQAILYDDAIKIESADYNAIFGIDEVLYMGTEKSTKVQLFLKNKMIQFTFFGDGSPLQWQDTIERMKDQQKSSSISYSDMT